VAGSGWGFLIGPERKRGSVTSTAATTAPPLHARDTPAICELSASPELVARGAVGELNGAGGRVEGASDGAPLRPRQLALLPGDERPVGPLPGSVVIGDNATLIARIAPLYLTGSVLDVTYGRGQWWRLFRPELFTGHDLELDGVDFRALPYGARAFDSVCFDPPYVPRQGTSPATRLEDREFRRRYGIDVSRSGAELRALIDDGLAECARVARRWLLVKCCDYTSGRQLHLGHVAVLATAERLGLRAHDLIVHASGSGPGGGQIGAVQRTRREHSYLIVLRRKGVRAWA
jgi:hypothetical protein